MHENIEHEITCYCEAKIKISLPEVIDLKDKPDTVGEINSGDFLKTVCPNCGTTLKPEFDLSFKLNGSEGTLRFLPEMDRETFYKGSIDCSGCSDLVIGYPELREYFLLKEYSLSRFPVESIKLHLLQKVPQGKEVEIYFEKLDNQSLIFHVLGLKEDQVGLVTVPVTTYTSLEQESSILKAQEPYSAMNRNPYLSVKLVSFVEDNQ